MLLSHSIHIGALEHGSLFLVMVMVLVLVVVVFTLFFPPPLPPGFWLDQDLHEHERMNFEKILTIMEERLAHHCSQISQNQWDVELEPREESADKSSQGVWSHSSNICIAPFLSSTSGLTPLADLLLRLLPQCNPE